VHAIHRTCYDEKFRCRRRRRHRLHQLNLTHYAHIYTSEIGFRADEARSWVVTNTIRQRLFPPKGFLTTTQRKKKMKASTWILLFCFSITFNVISIKRERVVTTIWCIDWCPLECCISDSIFYLPYTHSHHFNKQHYFGFYDWFTTESVRYTHTHTHTRLTLRRHSFLSSVSVCIRALLWHGTIGRGRERETGDMSWMMFSRERAYSLLFRSKKNE